MGRFFVLIGAMPLLIAAAAPTAKTPVVAAPTPTAQFSGDSGAIKFDPACRDYTIATLPTDKDCAARVERGETAPSIAIAARTIAESSQAADVTAALALIDRAIAAENHPAAHYLIGTILTTGEKIRPDYARGIPHLEAAAAHGNVAAADLLGTMTLRGKGTRQDFTRAIALYEQAAAGGMQGSAARLALLYLTGREVPKNEALAQAILQAAVAVGDSQAAGFLQMLEFSAKAKNYQAHPSADKAPEVRQYGTFDNPAIPPAFGFTDEFQKLYYSAYSDPATVARLERDQATLPTPFLYELARRIAPSSPDKARGYWMLARMRMQYDARRCADQGAMEAVRAWDALILPDIRFALLGMSPVETRAAVEFALQREAALPASTRPWWVCYAGMAAYTSADSAKPAALALSPEADWPNIRTEIRESLKSLLTPSPVQ